MMARDVMFDSGAGGLERALEYALDSAFRPIDPRREYLDTLRNRLMEEPDHSEEDARLQQMVLGGVGAFSAVLLIFATLRWVQHWRRGKD